jgi:hypothetical protein
MWKSIVLTRIHQIHSFLLGASIYTSQLHHNSFSYMLSDSQAGFSVGQLAPPYSSLQQAGQP